MVRLKAAADADVAEQTVFQFHYGTIKSANADIADIGARLFQFHYGTIKSLSPLLILPLLLDFNSTMVRLKANLTRAKVKQKKNFNSTMVRLKANGELPSISMLDNFNSTMVRLKAS